MKYLKFFEELLGKYKEETEIIYRDKDLVCLIPKSQMMSRIFGQKTNWCSITKNGFDMNAKYALYIRFIFRGGKKLRLTCNMFHRNYNWAIEDGQHMFTTYFKDELPNPFNIKEEEGYGYDLDKKKDTKSRIDNIPDACREKVIETIKKYKSGYDYILRECDYKPTKDEKTYNEYNRIKAKYGLILQKIKNTSDTILINIFFIKTSREYSIEYSFDFGVKKNGEKERNYFLEEESFKNSKEFEDRLKELIDIAEKRKENPLK